MFSNLEKECRKIELKSPVSGWAQELSSVPDPVFSSGMMGQGVAIEPSIGVLYSPVDGIVTHVFPTKHAIGIVTDDGMEILLHVGIDTVNLLGEGFECFVGENDRVKAGDRLLLFDIDTIKNKGKSVITPMVLINADIADNIEYSYGEVDTGSVVMTVRMKEMYS